MTLDPLTFALEILNFLVLLWLLQRFLYRPIRKAIEDRQQALEQGIRGAEEREQAAAALEGEYQARLVQWEADQAKQQVAFRQALDEERRTFLARVREEAEAERARGRIQAEQQKIEKEELARSRAVESALRLTGRMLKRLAGEHLDLALLDMVLEDLAALPESGKKSLKAALAATQGELVLGCAHALPADQVARLELELGRLLVMTVHCRTAVDPDLISGVRLEIGAHVLHGNLQDELTFLAREMADVQA